MTFDFETSELVVGKVSISAAGLPRPALESI